MTWRTISTVMKLPKETQDQILDHVVSLGFKRQYITGLRYDHCKFGSDKAENKQKSKNEL